MNIINNLYPPIVQDVLPAFLQFTSGDTRKIYFSISAYNSIQDIKNVQVSLISQSTNMSAFDSNEHPTGIKLCNLNGPDNSIEGDYKYYIEISASDLINESLEIDQFYKVQLRFTKKAPNTNMDTDLNNAISAGNLIDNWLLDYRDYFSEWSSICLIKAISQPTLNCKFGTGSQNIIVESSTFNLTGNISFANPKEQEYLKKYRIKIENFNNQGTYIYDSGDIYADQYNLNEFNCKISCAMTNNAYYNLLFIYTTNNLYSNQDSVDKIKFRYVQTYSTDTKVTIEAINNDQEGRIQIKISPLTTNVFNGNLVLQRASMLEDFLYWEDLQFIKYTSNTTSPYICYDIVAESGIWYKYRIQNLSNNRAILGVSNIISIILEHMFLTKNNIQLKLNFNPSVNDFKYNVAESQQITIGSKYPYIKRNGNNYFRSFSIGGLISTLSDSLNNNIYHSHTEENSLSNFHNFTSKQEIFGNNLSLYENYNQEKNISEYNDFIYERQFRNKVYDFLYANDIKLFKSTTEGNILVKLMNISFQPVQTLGRMIYSFTATAIEIDECNIENYFKYGILEGEV